MLDGLEEQRLLSVAEKNFRKILKKTSKQAFGS
jgi:hypothetical protein